MKVKQCVESFESIVNEHHLTRTIASEVPALPNLTPKRNKKLPLVDLTNDFASQASNTFPSTASIIPKKELSPKNEMLKTLLAEKEANPLPAIDKSVLIPPPEVVEKHQKLLTPCKIPTLAVKLSKASYFGPSIME